MIRNALLNVLLFTDNETNSASIQLANHTETHAKYGISNSTSIHNPLNINLLSYN